MIVIFKDVSYINEGKIQHGDILVKDGIIDKIDSIINVNGNATEVKISNNQYVIPGVIDDQVHFREPGLTHKADIGSESKAAVAGGVTSFMEMPNTKPSTLTQTLLQEKYDIAANSSFVNYSFFMGVSNDNYDEVMKTDMKNVCGLKIFMGSSTGNMLVDDVEVLEKIFQNSPLLIATHCEDEKTIADNLKVFQQRFGENILPQHHPLIRDERSCFLSSSSAVALAKKHNSRLHVLHISTADELKLFDNLTPLSEKKITAEVCVHHLSFTANDYDELGNQIKCNPAIKAAHHKAALWNGLLNDTLDIIATDHAPHTWEEKDQKYALAPSGLPLVQHSLVMMMDAVSQDHLSLEKMVEKMCHAPAVCFNLEKRGFIREGYYADLVVIDPQHEQVIQKENLLYKCGWSPLEGRKLKGSVVQTYINGKLAYDANKNLFEKGFGMRLRFN